MLSRVDSTGCLSVSSCVFDTSDSPLQSSSLLFLFEPSAAIQVDDM
jgi:hypothetical protein